MKKDSVPYNPLMSCCEPLFSLVAPLKDDKKASSIDADFREKILADFIAMEKEAFERQIGMVEYKDAKYALAAYIDELVLTSTWPGRLEWMSRPLQLEFFGEHTAGEGFFTRLANLRQGGEENLYLLELFYYCLQLGFEGVYKIKGLEHLMALQVDLKARSTVTGARYIRKFRRMACPATCSSIRSGATYLTGSLPSLPLPLFSSRTWATPWYPETSPNRVSPRFKNTRTWFLSYRKPLTRMEIFLEQLRLTRLLLL